MQMAVYIDRLLDRHDVNGKSRNPRAIANRTSFSTFNRRQFGSEVAFTPRGLWRRKPPCASHLLDSPVLFQVLSVVVVLFRRLIIDLQRERVKVVSKNLLVEPNRAAASGIAKGKHASTLLVATVLAEAVRANFDGPAAAVAAPEDELFAKPVHADRVAMSAYKQTITVSFRCINLFSFGPWPVRNNRLHIETEARDRALFASPRISNSDSHNVAHVRFCNCAKLTIMIPYPLLYVRSKVLAFRVFL